MNAHLQLTTPLLTTTPEPGVDVAVADVSPLMSDELFTFALVRVSERRRALVEATRNRKAQCQRLGATLLLDHLLQRHGLHECDMEYGEGTHGRPFFRNVPHISFSITHSGTVAAAALMPAPLITYGGRSWETGESTYGIARSVGIDVQKITPWRECVARLVLSNAELEAIRHAASPDDEFTRLWTLHESHVKATGEGITRPLPPLPAAARTHEYAFGDYRLALCLL